MGTSSSKSSRRSSEQARYPTIPTGTPAVGGFAQFQTLRSSSGPSPTTTPLWSRFRRTCARTGWRARTSLWQWTSRSGPPTAARMRLASGSGGSGWAAGATPRRW
ncbi:hypothetical protein CHLRE_09g399915v5 [Chlamydomonas reinhardtii]|uniref:Uncharacterized protein n=1 Tax=Chlamydomonas reinhardtii TaxID=3055 RepID=A0A2K3DCX6_CHLRE|nr:uncharacterized protein CHLRE_09g399915v5 [Chlamydomonas reinhardtii]PNW78381.1 hypothetical protein CHLRE_09g399915v5 [Chlamydomonas reinhardtii]